MNKEINSIQEIHAHTSYNIYNEKMAINLYMLDMTITDIEKKINTITDEKLKQELLEDIKELYNKSKEIILATIKKVD